MPGQSAIGLSSPARGREGGAAAGGGAPPSPGVAAAGAGRPGDGAGGGGDASPLLGASGGMAGAADGEATVPGVAAPLAATALAPIDGAVTPGSRASATPRSSVAGAA